MARQDGNLSGTERGISAVLGLSLMTLAGRRGHSLWRVLSGLAGVALLARAHAGYCGVKAAVGGKASLQDGLSEQWNRTRQVGGGLREGDDEAGESRSRRAAIDGAVNDSYTASDPPASWLPDEPPVNAGARWEAVTAPELAEAWRN